MTTDHCLECLAAIRAEVGDLLLIPMTYAALLESYGYEPFVAEAREAGATSFILVDLPVEERTELKRIQLVAPTSSDERIVAAAQRTDGSLYVVAVTGTTGVRAEVSYELVGLARRARTRARVPLYAGFGIATPEQARESSHHVDGVAIGSRAVQIAKKAQRHPGLTSRRCGMRSTRHDAGNTRTRETSETSISFRP